jgi:hypothetical protein
MSRLDLLLVAPSFRRAGAFLSITRYMGGSLRIGLWMVPSSPEQRAKSGRTDAQFAQFCVDSGAEIVDGRQPVEARLAILAQAEYDAATEALLAARLTADRVTVLMALSNGALGLAQARRLGASQAYTIDEDILRIRAERFPGEREQLAALPRIEVGLPFMRYPVLPEPPLDALIAHPTPFGLPTWEARRRYLVRVRSALVVLRVRRAAVKTHNSSEAVDFLTPFPWNLVARFPGVAGLAGRPRLTGPLAVAAESAALARVAPPLSRVTPYANFPLEAFLPGFRGVIVTGLSNSLWHALYARVPAHNCAGAARDEARHDKMHGALMAHLDVPPWDGSNAFDPRLFERVREDVRRGDLLGKIETSLALP